MRSSIIWALAGRGSYAGSQWLTMVVIAQLGGAAILGHYSYVLALITPAMMLAQLNMRALQVVDVKDEEGFSTYLYARIMACVVSFGALLLYAASKPEDQLLLGLMVGMICMKVAESVSDIYQGVMVKQENQKRIALSTLMKSVSLCVLIAVALKVQDSLTLGVWLVALAWWLGVFLYDVRIDVQYSRFDYRRALHLIWITLPFGCVMALSSAIVYIPVYWLKSAWGVEAVGKFSAMLFFLALGKMIQSTVVEVMLPRLAKHYMEGRISAMWKMIGQLSVLSCFIGVAGVLMAFLLGELLLVTCYGREFSGLSDVLCWVMASAAASYMASVAFGVLTLAKRGWDQLVLHLFVALVCIVCACIYVPNEGALGAAKSLFIAMGVMAIAVWCVLRWRLPHLWRRV